MKDLSDAENVRVECPSNSVDPEGNSDKAQNSNTQLAEFEESLPRRRLGEGRTCRVLRSKAEFTGKQALRYAPGISAETVGARNIHLQIVNITPGGRAKAHKHEGHESAIYVLSGESGMWYGDKLNEHLSARPGDFVYIPADVPHLPYNLSDTESCIVVIARTDPNEQESVVLLPELDSIHGMQSVSS